MIVKQMLLCTNLEQLLGIVLICQVLGQVCAYFFENTAAGEPVKLISPCVRNQFRVTDKVFEYQLCGLLSPHWSTVLQVCNSESERHHKPKP